MIDITDAIVHGLLVAFSGTVMLTSFLAYLERRSRRYLFLFLAFVFLALTEFVGLVEVLFYSTQLILIPFTSIHLSHFLEFLMLASFSLALLSKNKGVGSRDGL